MAFTNRMILNTTKPNKLVVHNFCIFLDDGSIIETRGSSIHNALLLAGFNMDHKQYISFVIKGLLPQPFLFENGEWKIYSTIPISSL